MRAFDFLVNAGSLLGIGVLCAFNVVIIVAIVLNAFN